MPETILQNFSPDSLAAAVEAGHADFFAHISRGAVPEGLAPSDLTQVLTGLPHPLFNGILHACLGSEGIDDRIEAALQPFRERGLPMFWWVGPCSRPLDLGERLQSHGLRLVGDMPGMAVDLRALADAPLPAGFEIEQVSDERGLREWGQVTNRSFDIPESMDEAWLKQFRHAGFDLPLRYYLGRRGGRPVAASVLGLFAGVAGLYGVATAEEARRQGYGAAITLAPLLEARAMGYRIGVLSASSMGFGVYQRLGFQECCQLRLFAVPDATRTEGEGQASGAA